jgi:hypothetical protein
MRVAASATLETVLATIALVATIAQGKQTISETEPPTRAQKSYLCKRGELRHEVREQLLALAGHGIELLFEHLADHAP